MIRNLRPNLAFGNKFYHRCREGEGRVIDLFRVIFILRGKISFPLLEGLDTGFLCRCLTLLFKDRLCFRLGQVPYIVGQCGLIFALVVAELFQGGGLLRSLLLRFRPSGACFS